MTLAGFLMDMLLIVMLAVMIFYATRLHKRLEILRAGKDDLDVMLRNLVGSTAAAERSLRDMRATADVLSQTLQKQITTASSTREELDYVLTSAEKTADVLLARIAQAKEITTAAPSYREAPTRMTQEEVVSAPVQTTAQTPIPTLNAVHPSAPAKQETKEAAKENAKENARVTAEQDLLRAIEKLR